MPDDAGQQTARAHRSLVEREAELIALDSALADLCGGPGEAGRRGHGGLLVYSGSAGLGKTALLTEVRRRAAARDCAVLSARGGEHEQRMPFHVVRQLVQPVLAAAPEEHRLEILGSWYDIVAPALGLVAAREGVTPDPTGVRDGLDWIMTRVVVEHTPAVLVLDDAHWADSESLTWLAGFTARADELPLLIVVAYRPEELPSGAPAFSNLAERHGARPFDLLAFTPRAVGDLVRDAMGEGSHDIFCRECWAVTGGNPFEIAELVTKARDRGLKAQEEEIPQLRELASAVKGAGLIERLRRLGPGTVRFAYAAAVLGTSIRPSAAARLAAVGAEQATDAVERLRQGRFLASGPGPDATLDFIHPLIATTVYRVVPEDIRVAMHGEAARSVVEAGLGAHAASRHLLETRPEGNSWAVQQLRTAAREYQQLGAPDAARRCLERALREPPPLEERAGVLYELGRACLLSEPAAAINHLRAALDEPDADSGLRDSIILRLAQALGHAGRTEEAVRTVAEEARHATHARTKLRMQAEELMWSSVRADEPDSPARSRRLAKLADHVTGRGPAERHILALRAWDATVRGEPATTALRYAEEALGDGLNWADESWGFEVPAVVALTFMYCDQPGRAEALFAEAIREMEHRGLRGSSLSFGFTLLAYIRFRRGKLAEAEDLVRNGLRIADRGGAQLPAQWQAIGSLIEILLARGRTEEAVELANTRGYGTMTPPAVIYPDSQTVFSELLLAQGLNAEAERRLRAVGRRLDTRAMRNPSWCPWQFHLAAAVAHVDPQRAIVTAGEALARAHRFGTQTAIGTASHTLATVTRGPERMKLLSEAVRHLERSPSAYELARALVSHGAALRRAGLPQDAAEQLHRGLESATQCGAEALASRAREELAADGFRPVQLLRDETRTLTAQEILVAQRVVLGHSTAKIADDLATHERTVSELLSIVYRKVGSDHNGLAKVLSTDTDVR